jgi:hypothetical protein
LILIWRNPIQKGRKFFSEKTEKTWRKRKRQCSATFLLHLGEDRIRKFGGKIRRKTGECGGKQNNLEKKQENLVGNT